MMLQAGPGSVVVGIATHNRADVLRKAIQSAFDQSHKSLRVAVIDDASTDETPAVLQEFKPLSSDRWDPGQGYVRARNRLMLDASEDYYVSLDDDAWFIQGDEIAIAIDLLERYPKVAAVAFDIISPDRPQCVPRGPQASVALFIGCGHVLRLSVVKALGGYAEFPGAYGVEEKDLCLRLIDAGYEIVKLDGVHVWHDKTSLARDLPRQHRSGVCNDLALALRRVPVALVFPILAMKISKHVVFAIRRGLLGPCGQGLGDFVLAAAGVWRARHPVRLSSLAQFYSLSRTPRKFPSHRHGASRSISMSWLEPGLLRIPRGIMSRLRLRIYRSLGMRQGKHNRMEGGGRVRRCSQIEIGDNNAFTQGCWLWPEDTDCTDIRIRIGNSNYFNRNVMIDACGSIQIGDCNMFGPDVYITDSNHRYAAGLSPSELPMDRGIVVIGNRCWIGAKVTILKGVTLGDGCVVGAGAVVTRAVKPYEVVAGVPARPLVARSHLHSATSRLVTK